MQETKGKDLPLYVPKEHYTDVKNNQFTDKYPKWYIGAIGYLASYNGRYFDGGYAKTVISKTGAYRNYYDESRRNVVEQINNLQDVIFTNKDYKEMKNVKNTLIYCDIPYKDKTDYGTFGKFNHEDFWKWVRKFSENNIIIVSELQAPDDFICIWEQEVTRTQNNKTRSQSIEKLFIYNKIYKKYIDKK